MNRENLLLDFLPETVLVDGKKYPIDSNFRTGIIFEIIMSENTLTTEQKLKEIFNMYFTDDKPVDFSQGIMAILDFYALGKQPTSKNKKSKNNANKSSQKKDSRIYDFRYDDGYIYAAFLTQYNIDLNEIEHLHWWKFQSLFKALESTNKIVEIMGYRDIKLSSIKDKNERIRIANLQEIYRLPDNMTFEDKVANAGAIFGGAI